MNEGKIKIASANYQLERHSSWEAYKFHLRSWVKVAVTHQAEILLFPEYASIELVSLMSTEIQKDLRGQLNKIQSYKKDFIHFFKELAVDQKIFIVAPSFPDEIAENEIRNRAFVFYPDGRIDFQEKNMMTRFENEEWKVKRGEQVQKVFEYKNIKLGINICYDVEFPDFARELALSGVEVLLVPSCTENIKGMNRVHVGARARALENQMYVVVSQTVGTVDYSEAIDLNTGMSSVYSTCDVGFPDDGIISTTEINENIWLYAELDLNLIHKVRESGRVFNFNDMKHLIKNKRTSS